MLQLTELSGCFNELFESTNFNELAGLGISVDCVR